jgi:hypothetical protein
MDVELHFTPTSPSQVEEMLREDNADVDHTVRMENIRQKIRQVNMNIADFRHSIMETDDIPDPIVTQLPIRSRRGMPAISSEQVDKERQNLDAELQRMLSDYESNAAAKQSSNTVADPSNKNYQDAQLLQELSEESDAISNKTAVDSMNISRLVDEESTNNAASTTGLRNSPSMRGAPSTRARSRGGRGNARMLARPRQNSRNLGVHTGSNATNGDPFNSGNADSGDTSIVATTKRATRVQHRIANARRIIGDRLGSHYLRHQSIQSLQKEARPLAALIRTVGQTLRDVSLGSTTASTQLESTLCDTLYDILEQWHGAIKECVAHMQRMQPFLEVMYNHLQELNDNVNSIQANFLQRQCHAADAAGHRAILHGMIERRNALELEQSSGDARPTEMWGNTTQILQLPMFVASRDVCSTHAANSFKGIEVEFAPRKRNSSRAKGGSGRGKRGGGRASSGTKPRARRANTSSDLTAPSDASLTSLTDTSI